MIIPEQLRTWREEFLAEFSIDQADLVHPDYEDVGTECEKRWEKTHPRIPLHYHGALATDPGVRKWMAGAMRAAIATRRVVVSISTGPSLLLLGPTGTGKTFQAYGAICGFAVCGVMCQWQAISAADLYAQMRPRHHVDSEAEFEKFSRVGLLVLDDLGVAKGSEWVEEINYRLVNHRYEHGMPTLITSNVPPRDLAAVLGERVASRLTEMAQRATLKGADRRRAAA